MGSPQNEEIQWYIQGWLDWSGMYVFKPFSDEGIPNSEAKETLEMDKKA